MGECGVLPADDPSADAAAGWAVAQSAARAAAARFGSRLRSVYALGSLAHGGFCPLVSDVDVGIILAGRSRWDRARIHALTAGIRRSGAPLADRLSLFWGTRDSLTGSASWGRFPAHDRLDLIRHGQLIAGAEIRGALPEPSYCDLVTGTARFAVSMLAGRERRREIADARYTAAQGPRAASKVALFPVRFLFTARSGRIGQNQAAVGHYLAVTAPGPTADLAAASLRWRSQWLPADRDRAVRLLDAAAAPLYQEFAGEYADRLREMGRARLADDLSAAAAGLARH
jgi:hypothetical protein